MNTDPRSALAALIAAFERHYEAVAASRGDDDPHLDAATERLADAFNLYDDALFDSFDVSTPFVVFDGDDDDEDDDEDDWEDIDDLDDDDLDDEDWDEDDDDDEWDDDEEWEDEDDEDDDAPRRR